MRKSRFITCVKKVHFSVTNYSHVTVSYGLCCKPLREIEPLSTAGFIDTQMQWSVTLSCLLYSLALPSITRSALKCMPHSLRRFSLSPRIAAYSLSCQNALQKKQIAEISRDNFHRSPYCPIAHNMVAVVR